MDTMMICEQGARNKAAEAGLTVLRKTPNGLAGHPISAQRWTTYCVQDAQVCAGDGGPGDSGLRNPGALSVVLTQQVSSHFERQGFLVVSNPAWV